MDTQTNNQIARFATLEGAQSLIQTKRPAHNRPLSVAQVNDAFLVCRNSVDKEGVSVGVSYLCRDASFRINSKCDWTAILGHSLSDPYAEYRELPLGEIIDAPGKFVGEPRYVPEFWEVALSGDGDYLTDHPECAYDIAVSQVEVETSDKIRYPELENVSHVNLWETSDGFVYSEEIYAK